MRSVLIKICEANVEEAVKYTVYFMTSPNTRKVGIVYKSNKLKVSTN
jgi:hypothetical protein